MNESEFLFTEVLHCDRLSLHLNKDKTLGADITSRISSVLKRRMLGEPICYILGKIEFMGLEFKVDKAVLIPRPETEVLVETLIRYSNNYFKESLKLNIMDIGTGSGCIAVSLAKMLPQASLTGVDISEEALEVARVNAGLNNVSENISFLCADLFPVYPGTVNKPQLPPESYDMIISNPPYIPSAEIPTLQQEVRHEPCIALDGGSDGLDFYRRIIERSPEYLKSKGLLIMEIGFGQNSDVKKIFQKSAKFEIIEVVKDYNGINRVMVAQILSSK